jgi:pimeloyl-ACP methyl ester carboxylesterase
VSDQCDILLFPGMGVDARMFAELKRRIRGLEVAPWNQPTAEPDLAAYARTYVPLIERLRPRVIGGCSFGGMLALEIARLVKPERAVLIGSCRDQRSIHWTLRFFSKIAGSLPRWSLRMRSSLSSLACWYFGVERPEQRGDFVAMLRETSPDFLRWASSAVGGWPGASDLALPIMQIHGQQDRLMPSKRSQASEFVANAGHMVAMTHAQEIADFLVRAAGARLTDSLDPHGDGR